MAVEPYTGIEAVLRIDSAPEETEGMITIEGIVALIEYKLDACGDAIGRRDER